MKALTIGQIQALRLLIKHHAADHPELQIQLDNAKLKLDDAVVRKQQRRQEIRDAFTDAR